MGNYTDNPLYGGGFGGQQGSDDALAEISSFDPMAQNGGGGQGIGGGPAQGGVNPQGAMPYVAAGLGAIQTGAEIVGDYRQTSRFDVEESLPGQQYNPYYQPPQYYEQQTPTEISEGTGGRAALQYGVKGAAAGAQVGTLIGGPVGTVVGAGVGALGGAIAGAFKGKKARELRGEFDQIQGEQYNDYLDADRRYGDITGTRKRAMAKAKSFSNRGVDTVPIYNSQIYGFT